MGLKDITFPFEPSSEEDVRVQLAFYFNELGFSSDEMSFEDHFEITLGRTAIRISKNSQMDRASGYSDLLLIRNGLPLAMVEVKGPEISLDESHKDQGLSYARLLRDMPPYTIVTNGTDFQVYDTITTDLLESGSPQDSSWWINGSSFDELELPDSNWAAKKVVEMNFEIFKDFSVQQTKVGLSDLKGDPFEGYRYSPDLFLKRSSVTKALFDFELSDQVCFGIHGKSGFGKTNTLCHLIEELNQTDSLALFYRCTRLWKGLTDAIIGDFLWEFDTESSISDIIKRLDVLAIAHDTKIYIFIDGLDEFPSNIENFKGELIDFSQRLSGTSIRLILTCKSHDWSSFIRDRGRTLNYLGRQIFPTQVESPSPGLLLQGFEDSELEEVWILYSQKYSISGSLEGETKEVCRTPLMLRFVSETYKNSTPPPNLSDIEIFQNYWKSKMEEFSASQRQAMELIISKAAQLMIDEDQEEIEESILFSELDPTYAQSEEYENLFRFHFLLRKIEENSRTLVSFPFRKLRAYVYTIISQKWDRISAPEEIIAETSSAISTRQGAYALFFFLSIINTVKDNWLTLLIQHDFSLFLKIYREIFSYSHETLRLTDEKLQEEFGERVERFIERYSLIRNNFDALKTKLVPFTVGDAGIYVIGPWHGYRTRTKKYPSPIVLLEDEAYSQLKARNSQMLLDILPEGGISNSLPFELRDKIPEILAWEEINKQIANLVEDRLLDESQSPMILNERIHYIITEGPSIGVEGSPRGYYWEFLGYESLLDAQNADCDDLIERSKTLYGEWVESAKEVGDNFQLQRWYQIQQPNLYALSYLLESFIKFSDKLFSPGSVLEAVFSYFGDPSLENVSRIALEQLDNIKSSYCSLLETNFPQLLDEFSFYKYKDSQILIEISRDSGTPWKSDYLHLAYIILPTAGIGDPIIREVVLDQSIAEKFIPWQRSAGNILGFDVKVDTVINGTRIVEPNALISRTKFPSNQLISDQAYQLISNEAEFLFGGRMEWMDADHGNFNTQNLAYTIRKRQILSKLGY